MFRRRKKRVSKIQLTWKLLVVTSLLLHALQIYSTLGRYISSMPAVRRTTTVLAIKGWLSNWEMQGLVDWFTK